MHIYVRFTWLGSALF